MVKDKNTKKRVIIQSCEMFMIKYTVCTTVCVQLHAVVVPPVHTDLFSDLLKYCQPVL